MIHIFINRLLDKKGIAKHPVRTKNSRRVYKIFLGILCVFVATALFGAPPPAMAQPSGARGEASSADGGYVPDEVLVKVSSSASGVQRKSLGKIGKATESGLEVSGGDLLVLKVPAGTVKQAIADLQKQPGVIYAEPNYYVTAQEVIPNDPAFLNHSQYGLQLINAPAAWEITKGAAGVTIAIIDSGVDFHQPDLAAKIVKGTNILNPSAKPQDDNRESHGTVVASVAAALTNNHEGIAGVSWGARIMPVKVLDANGNGDFFGVAAGIIFATKNNARVINLSLGGSPDPAQNGEDARTLCGAVADAVAAGVVVVAAAGNTYGGDVLYPAACPDALAVTGTDSSNQIALFSPRGSQIALSAPGVEIIGDGRVGGGRPSLVTLSGTSLSAPFVSGAAAILLGIPGNATYNNVVRQMETTALNLGAHSTFGFGLLQLDAALQLAVSEHPLPPTPTATEPKKRDEGDGIVGPTDTPEFAGSGGFGGGGGAISSTPTATATATSTSTATSTLTATATSTDTPAATPGAALAVKTTSPPAVIIPMPPMPWVAGFFLLAGMVLIGYALVLRRNT
jgi:subtilisin family serine protease